MRFPYTFSEPLRVSSACARVACETPATRNEILRRTTVMFCRVLLGWRQVLEADKEKERKECEGKEKQPLFA